ncbi:uncharacterized protein LOC126738344 [Anthonomus grandis grandis]|uniref:uncharacterized protein LOC126738344 n=1 Tax=Anthonomus grandis grandis TaxID=2921223 RepID=UPI0021667324|nr:uncharacterized protein LOC126738344 [Anthonomus grandis grandis]
MGVNPSKPDNRDSHSSTNSAYLSYVAIFSKLEQKESIFPAIQEEIEYASAIHDRKQLKSLACELAAHILDLNQLKHVKLDKDDQTRRLVATEKYEMALGKLKSILSIPEVTDTISDDKETDSSVAPKNLEDEELCCLTAQYDKLWNQIVNTQVSLDDYCQIDRDLFCLQVRLRDFQITPESSLFDINNEVSKLRTVVNKRIDNLELFDHFSQQIKTLELRVAIEDGNKQELSHLDEATRSLENDIEDTNWEDGLIERKTELLCSLNKVKQNIKASDIKKDIKVDKYCEADTFEEIYGNIDIIRKCTPDISINHEADNLPPPLPRRKMKTAPAGSNERGTIYINNDILQVSDHIPSILKVKSRPPQPLPRRSEEKVINNLPKYWMRLDELVQQEFATEEDKLEILQIRKHAEEARMMFERRLAELADKFQESIDI